MIFRKEIYATACIAGGALYFGLLAMNLKADIAQIVVITFIVTLRIIVVRYKLALPRFGY